VPRPIDSVVVPAARTADHLGPAGRLAAELGAQCVALCSREARAGAVVERVDAAVEAIDLPLDYHHPLLELTTSRAVELTSSRLGDLSTKRNLALLLARLAGWRTVLFLDDDIVEVRPDTVRSASRYLGAATAVGFPVTDFPDNSVVCHARRLAGECQDVFVSGSALLVDTARVRSFFPRIYNEDWLFLLDDVWSGRVVRADPVRQLPYDPFADAGRAENEEFGELIAEGLMQLTRCARGDRRSVLQAAGDERWWRHARYCREADVGRTAALIDQQRGRREGSDVLRALAAAGRRRDAIAASALAAYVRAWRSDRRRWAARIEDIPTVGSFRLALQWLGLVSHTRLSNVS